MSAATLSPLPTFPAGTPSPAAGNPSLKPLAPLPPASESQSPLTKPTLPVFPLDNASFIEFPTIWPISIATLPIESSTPGRHTAPPWLRPFPVDNPAPALPFAAAANPTAKPPQKPAETPQPTPPTPDFTDDDLREAFYPIVEHAVRSAVYARENGIDTHLEPMLRATIRRALAEYSPATRPFHPPGSVDRFLWRLQALFTSRSYEDILFEKTHRFQVEEVFVVDSNTLALVSFASSDPARHASARRIEGTVQRLALQLRDPDGKLRASFELPDQRHVVACPGKFIILMAIVRGETNELVLSDLDFSLRRIEDRFRDRFAPDGPPLLLELQPFLEDCLLIQAPATAA